MSAALRVAVVAATETRRRVLVGRVEAAGHQVVEAGAQVVLADATADTAQVDTALRAAAALIGPAQSREIGAGFDAVADAPTLTPREAEILAALGDGLSNKEVARELGISAHTVKFHLETIFRKLDATSRAEAVAKGLRQGIIEL